jgi:hypothetical protein
MFFLFCILFTFLDNSLMLVFMFIIFPIESLDRCIDIDHTVSKCLSTHSFINGQHLYFLEPVLFLFVNFIQDYDACLFRL